MGRDMCGPDRGRAIRAEHRNRQQLSPHRRKDRFAAGLRHQVRHAHDAAVRFHPHHALEVTVGVEDLVGAVTAVRKHYPAVAKDRESILDCGIRPAPLPAVRTRGGTRRSGPRRRCGRPRRRTHTVAPHHRTRPCALSRTAPSPRPPATRPGKPPRSRRRSTDPRRAARTISWAPAGPAKSSHPNSSHPNTACNPTNLLLAPLSLALISPCLLCLSRRGRTPLLFPRHIPLGTAEPPR